MLGTYHVGALLEVLQRLHSIAGEDRVWQYLVERCCEVLKAQAGTFFVLEKDQETVKPFCTYGIPKEKLEQVPFRIGIGVCGWVAKYMQTARVDQAEADPRFYKAADLVTGIKTRNILCVPVTDEGNLVGVLELINHAGTPFSDKDQEFLEYVGRQSTAAVRYARLKAHAEELAAYYGSILENLPGGFLACDLQGQVTLVNPMAAKILRLQGSSDWTGRSVESVLKGCPELAQILLNTLQTQKRVHREEIQIRHGSDSLLIGYSTILIRGGRGQVIGGGILFQDITFAKVSA